MKLSSRHSLSFLCVVFSDDIRNLYHSTKWWEKQRMAESHEKWKQNVCTFSHVVWFFFLYLSHLDMAWAMKMGGKLCSQSRIHLSRENPKRNEYRAQATNFNKSTQQNLFTFQFYFFFSVLLHFFPATILLINLAISKQFSSDQT